MKRAVLPFVLSVLFALSSAFPQTLMDYVSSVKGDTLLIKDYYEMNNEPNSLYYALLLDTVNVPTGRVYLLKADGYYPNDHNINPSSSRAVTVAGEDNGILVHPEKVTSTPPLICGEICECAVFPFGINVSKELTIKNCNLTPASADGSVGWTIFNLTADNAKLTVDNCLMEHTLGTFINIPHAVNCDVMLKNCYMVNISGNSCRRNGGVLDISGNQDTLLVENSTHIMAQGFLYNFRDYSFKRTIFNHNTFINCANLVFMDRGFQKAVSVTNNMFINSNVLAYSGDKGLDPGESDLDPAMPIGIINVASLDSTKYKPSDIHFYVDNNLIYWDPKWDLFVAELNNASVGGYYNWQSQRITMNSRTQWMFNDPMQFPNLVENNWIIGKLPAFADTRDLFTTQLQAIYDYANAAADPNATEILPVWRLINTPAADHFLHADWPIPVDLSYSDADLKKAAWGFPVGDLNWFPIEKAKWMVERACEYTNINNALNYNSWERCYPSSVEDAGSLAKEFELNQNYPNPFNPTTKIKYSIPTVSASSHLVKGEDRGGVRGGFVFLKVYDILGREAAVLVNEYKKPGNYEVEFNGSNLPSGVYFYQIRFGDNTISKKMILMK